jgi:hypothetical protein
MTTCNRCGRLIETTVCPECREKDIKAAFPCVILPEGVELNHVDLDPMPGGPCPQPMTVAQAVERRFLLVVGEGNSKAYYPLTRRVKLYVKRPSLQPQPEPSRFPTYIKG